MKVRWKASPHGKTTTTTPLADVVVCGKEVADAHATKVHVTRSWMGVACPRILRYADRKDILRMCFGTIGAIVRGAIIPAWTILLGLIINLFLNNPDVRSGVQAEVAPYVGAMIGFGVVAMTTAHIQYASFHISSERQSKLIRRNYLRAVLYKEQAFFDNNLVGFLTSTLNSIDNIQDVLGPKSPEICRYIAQTITAFVIAFATNWELALVTLATLPFAVTSLIAAKKATVGKAQATGQAYKDAAIFADETISSVRVVQTMPESLWMLEDRYCTRISQVLEIGKRHAWIVGTATGIVYALIPLSFSLGLWYGSRMVYNGELDGGQVVTVFTSVLVGKTALSFLQPGIVLLVTGNAAAGTVFDIIDSEVKIDARSTEGVIPSSECEGHIVFKDVKFSYPSRADTMALKGISYTAKPGQTVALVGGSGSGKSSCVALIQRLYDVQDGKISIDGHELRDLNVRWLREQIGVVCQEPILFNISIADNISCGRTVSDKDAIIEAAKAANAHDFICELPNGYDTLVGERGGKMSGGQKQRIALARALLGNPKILLLDEATSALDNKSERIVQDALDKAAAGRTTIVVAHRLSTIQNADRIIVMNGGKILEQGTHKDLLHNGRENESMYTMLWTIQSDSAVQNVVMSKSEQNLVNCLSSNSTSPSCVSINLGSPYPTTHIPIDISDTLEDSNGQIGEVKDNLQKNDENYIFQQHKTLYRVILLSKPELLELVLGSIGSVVYGAVYPVMGYVFSLLVSSLTGPGVDSVRTNGDFYACMFIVLAAVHGLSSFVKDVSLVRAGEKLTHRLRTKCFSSILRKDLEFFDHEENATGILTTKLAVDCQLIQSLFTQQLGSVMAIIGVMLSSAIISFLQSWRLSLVLFCMLPFFGVAGILNYKVGEKGARAGKLGRARALGRATEFISNAKTITTLRIEDVCVGIFENEWAEAIQGSSRHSHNSGLAAGFVDFLLFAIYAIGFSYGSYLYSIYDVGLQEVLICFQGILFTAILIQQMVPTIADTSKAKVASKSIMKLLDDIPVINATIDESSSHLNRNSMNGTLEFCSVRFAYPNRPDSCILKGLSFKVSKGETIALVGHSGSGKSTALQLMDRFYDPNVLGEELTSSPGMVMVDGFDIRTIPISHLRRLIGVVSQEPVLFNLTIAENIRFGLTEVSDEQVTDAARLANAHNFIMEQPEGYNTIVGERGGRLSGGQKQRVAIARALIRDPRILILDEATSALDTESEQIVQEALKTASKGRTTVVVAHRLSTVRNADRIIVLNHGKIVESGSHNELLAIHDGYYQELTRTSGCQS
eukprot:CFRG7501T1